MIYQETLDDTLAEKGWCQVLVTTPEPGLAAAAVDEGEILDHFMDDLPELEEDTTAAFTKRVSKRKRRASRYFPRLGVALGYVETGQLPALGASASVESVFGTAGMTLIEPVQSAAVHHESAMTWGLISLGVQKLWDQGLNGSGVAVGHLDTGVDGSHPSLRNRLKEYLRVDRNGHEKSIPPAEATDSGTHGTHTAGTICGEAGDGLAFGVAPGVDLFSAEVIEGGRVMLRILAGMEWALQKQVRILNMSLGFRGFNPFFMEITRRLRDQNVLPVFAIGNEGRNTSRSPGNYAQALSVGAIDRSSQVADFSGSQRLTADNHPDPSLAEPRQPDLVAPGVSVISARPGGGVASKGGTSMATPHVAGVAALLMQAKPAATADQIESALRSTCRPLTEEPDTLRWGNGAIVPSAALAAL